MGGGNHNRNDTTSGSLILHRYEKSGAECLAGSQGYVDRIIVSVGFKPLLPRLVQPIPERAATRKAAIAAIRPIYDSARLEAHLSLSTSLTPEGSLCPPHGEGFLLESKCSRFSSPFDPRKISFFIVANLKFALIGIADSFGDPVRNVDVGGRNDDRIRTLFDSHDPVERVLLLLQRLVISNQRKQVAP